MKFFLFLLGYNSCHCYFIKENIFDWKKGIKDCVGESHAGKNKIQTFGYISVMGFGLDYENIK